MLVLGRVHQRFVTEFLLDLEMVVVTRVEVEDAPIEFHDMGGHPIQEVAVVADEHEAAGPFEQELLEPEEALQIQVVGRLVQEQQVRPLHEQTSQGHPHAPSSGELPDRPLEIVVPKGHAPQDRLSAGLKGIAVGGFEGRLQARPSRQAAARVVVGGVGSRRRMRRRCVRRGP